MPIPTNSPTTHTMRVTQVLEELKVGDTVSVSDIVKQIPKAHRPKGAQVYASMKFYERKGDISKTGPATFMVLKPIHRSANSFRAGVTTRQAIYDGITKQFTSVHQLISARKLLDFTRSYETLSATAKSNALRKMVEQQILVKVTPQTYKPGAMHPLNVAKSERKINIIRDTDGHDVEITKPQQQATAQQHQQRPVAQLAVTQPTSNAALMSMALRLESLADDIRAHAALDAARQGVLLKDASKNELIDELRARVAD